MDFESDLVAPLDALARDYGKGANPLKEIGALAATAITKLQEDAKLVTLGDLEHREFGKKSYVAYRDKDFLSRPLNKALYSTELQPPEFLELWRELIGRIDRRRRRLQYSNANNVLYQAVQAVAGCYDIWKRKSRKSPGTFFEIMIGSLFTEVTGLPREKQVKTTVTVGDESEDVHIPTDLVLRVQKDRGVVVASKTSTRERVSQAYIQQVLLNAAFGEGIYSSMLVMVSEVQHLDDHLQETCVPLQVAMYERHIVRLLGFFYLDPPFRYLALGRARVVPVSTVGELLAGDLARIVSP